MSKPQFGELVRSKVTGSIYEICGDPYKGTVPIRLWNHGRAIPQPSSLESLWFFWFRYERAERK